MATNEPNRLGEYLRHRREQIDAAALGLAVKRRRTSGLRREEVAQRANISPAWYISLEQGRGGAASPDVLDRLASALILNEVEREHLFLLGLGHPPEVRYRAEDSVSPWLQRILDALPDSPAVLKTATWDVLAWNRATAAVLFDYGKVPPAERNVLRLLFCDPSVRARQPGWEDHARAVVAAFRTDAARAGADVAVAPLVAELSAQSPEFAAMWQDKEVRSAQGTVKILQFAQGGQVKLEYASLAVDGRPDQSIVIWNPVTERDRRAVQLLLQLQKQVRVET